MEAGSTDALAADGRNWLSDHGGQWGQTYQMIKPQSSDPATPFPETDPAAVPAHLQNDTHKAPHYVVTEAWPPPESVWDGFNKPRCSRAETPQGSRHRGGI